MRKSLMDLPSHMVRKDEYPGLPEELREMNYWIADCGRSIMCIPRCLLDEARKSGDLGMYEVPIPVRYVIERGYEMIDGFAIVDASYSQDMGVEIEGDYEEW